MPFRVSLVSLVTLLSFASAAFAASAPDPTEGAYEIGAAAYKAGQFQKARQYFESAAIKHPTDPNVHYGLAETYVALGKTQQGLQEYAKTIKLAPNSKLASFARIGQQYASQIAEQATLAKMAKLAQNSNLPVPSQPTYFPPQAPPSQPTGVIRSSGYGSGYGYGSNITYAPLPQPTYPSYGPPPQQMSFPVTFSHRRYGYGGRYYHTPQLEVRSYGYAPPLNIIAKQEPPPPVELLAKQERLVLDEKSK